MATDSEQLVLSISADVTQIKRALSRLSGDAKTTAKSIETSFNNVNVGPMGQRASQSMKAVQNDARNLSFQLNDIATSLSTGASPFTVMMQQGSQVAQVMQGISAQGGSMGTVLAGAFRSMISPIALVSFALIAVAGYAYQYFTSVDEGSEKADKAFKKQVDALDSLRKKYEDVLSTASKQALTDIINAQEFVAGTREVEGILTALRANFKAVFDQLDLPELNWAASLNFNDATKIANSFLVDWQALIDAVAAGENPLAKVNELIAFLDSVELKTPGTGAGAFADTLRTKLLPGLEKIRDTEKALAELREKAGSISEEQIKQQEELAELVEKIRGIGKGQITDAEKLLDLYRQLVEQARTMGEVSAANQLFAAGAETITLGGTAAELIKKEEGFRPGAYWDSNAFRVGFGSDTYVDEMGKIQKVTEDTVVTLTQANADLARRITEFQSTIQRQIGPDMWRAFTEEQQAALTSIAYNYGQLPASIVKAIQKGDQGQVATAIANLSANPERRQREARLFAGGSAAAGDALKVADEAARAAEREAEARATATQNLAEYLEKLDEQATLEQRITEITTSGLSAEDKARAIAVETELQTALNLAKQNGLTLTEKEIEQIRAATLAKTEAKIAGEVYVQSQKDSADAIKQFNQQVASMAQSAISGLVNDLRNGVEAGEAFNNMLNRIIDSLIQMALQSFFQPGGLFGSLMGVPAAATGGIVGQSITGRRNVSPLVFAGAPRFASGGMVGLRSGEVPIIAHRGEMIIPKNMVGRGGAGGGNTYNFNDKIAIDMSKTGLVAADSDSAKAFGENVQKLIQAEMVRESRPGGLLRRPG